MRIYSLFILLLISFAAFAQEKVDPTNYVNPFIGTTNFGATNPGAVAPWGMVSVTPFNVAGPGNSMEKDSGWLSVPYEVNNTRMSGFSHINLSGVGCPDLGSLIVMPTTGDLVLNHEEYASEYENEMAVPGHYSVDIKKYNIHTETAATQRVGLTRFEMPAGSSNILLNLGLGLTNESGGMIEVVSGKEIQGFRMVGDFCYNAGGARPVYFVMELDKAADEFGVWKKNPKLGAVENNWSKYSDKIRVYENYKGSIAADSLGAYFRYQSETPQTITAKIGISYVSIENARKNLNSEVPGFDFDSVVKETRSSWSELLSRITVEGGSEQELRMFYTSIYHMLLHPNVLQDVNGDYPIMEGYDIKNTKGNRFTTFSLWDTYRNVHSFLSLVYPEVQLDMVNSMVDMYKESGWLPKWELAGKETLTMVGDPAAPVIVDTYMRGLTDFDVTTAYEAMKKAATQLENNKLRPGLSAYIDKGYIPVGFDGVWGSLSTTLEYNFSDWNLSVLANELGNKSDAELFKKRSLSYSKFYDSEIKVLRPIDQEGNWHTPFDPGFGKNFEAVPGYVEGTAWQYTFFVPHDVQGLIKLFGGKRAFLSQLNMVFEEEEFSMINEPDITYPYLYNHLKGEEWRTQETVQKCIATYYNDGPAGLPGNDDTGTLSAWLAFSMMGIYPDCPGNPNYTLTTPTFDKVRIKLNSELYPGDELIIEKSGNGKYIQSVEWNGKRTKGYFFDHNTLVKGGTLKFTTRD